MRKYISIIFTSIIIYSLISCGNATDKKVAQNKDIDIEHFNIIIVPDLSNRIDNNRFPKPIDDSQFVSALIDDIYPNILKNRVDINQTDKIQMKFTSSKIINLYDINNSKLKFDFGDFKSQVDRIKYLVNRDNKAEFSHDKDAFKTEFSRVLAKARAKTCGADLWTFFNNDLNKTCIHNEVRTIEGKKFRYHHKYKNIIVLLTDGYVEAGLYGKNNGQKNKKYHLSGRTVKEFRKQFKRSGEMDMKTFFAKNGYGLMPMKNSILKDVEVLAVEFYDRSLTPAGNATVHPTDGEILELFWNDWMRESGVKKFKCCKIASSTDEFMEVFHEFAGIKVRR